MLLPPYFKNNISCLPIIPYSIISHSVPEHRNKTYLLSANDVHKLPNPDYSPSKISGKKKVYHCHCLCVPCHMKYLSITTGA